MDDSCPTIKATSDSNDECVSLANSTKDEILGYLKVIDINCKKLNIKSEYVDDDVVTELYKVVFKTNIEHINICITNVGINGIITLNSLNWDLSLGEEDAINYFEYLEDMQDL